MERWKKASEEAIKVQGTQINMAFTARRRRGPESVFFKLYGKTHVAMLLMCQSLAGTWGFYCSPEQEVNTHSQAPGCNFAIHMAN